MPLQVPTYEIYMNLEGCEPSILYGVLSLLKSTTHRPFECMVRPLGGGAQMDHTVSGNRLLASPPKRGHYFVVAPNLDGLWTVSGQPRGAQRVFVTQREAIRFALYETGRNPSAAALLTPPRAALAQK